MRPCESEATKWVCLCLLATTITISLASTSKYSWIGRAMPCGNASLCHWNDEERVSRCITALGREYLSYLECNRSITNECWRFVHVPQSFSSWFRNVTMIESTKCGAYLVAVLKNKYSEYTAVRRTDYRRIGSIIGLHLNHIYNGPEFGSMKRVWQTFTVEILPFHWLFSFFGRYNIKSVYAAPSIAPTMGPSI